MGLRRSWRKRVSWKSFSRCGMIWPLWYRLVGRCEGLVGRLAVANHL